MNCCQPWWQALLAYSYVRFLHWLDWHSSDSWFCYSHHITVRYLWQFMMEKIVKFRNNLSSHLAQIASQLHEQLFCFSWWIRFLSWLSPILCSNGWFHFLALPGKCPKQYFADRNTDDMAQGENVKIILLVTAQLWQSETRSQLIGSILDQDLWFLNIFNSCSPKQKSHCYRKSFIKQGDLPIK